MAAEWQNEVKGCRFEIGAPNVKIRIMSSEIHHLHF